MTIYPYQPKDKQMLQDRVEQYREQVDSYLSGQLTEEEFRPLRLMNGLYVQAHAPMLRIAIPYGIMDTRQLRGLAAISDDFDRGWGHFTTRQNLQLNWVKLEQTPDILSRLADIDMHAIQTSGNCIRNITIDHLAGVAPDEVEDPRLIAECMRQWSTFHPEFSFLPRKFKIAIKGARADRSAIQFHDIGIFIRRNDQGLSVADIYVGGGLGRTPVIGKCIKQFLPIAELLRYLTAVMRVYNLYGRRDNKFKARIKILVNALGVDAFSEKVEETYGKVAASQPALDSDLLQSMQEHFAEPDYEWLADESEQKLINAGIPAAWLKQNTSDHKITGYSAVYVSLKSTDAAPGDMTSEQMRWVADLADRFSLSEVRTVHTQNLLLPYVKQKDLPELYQALLEQDLARPNMNTATDIICCPGLDFCGLANTDTINVTRSIDQAIAALPQADSIGGLKIKISGCMNACGHHHIGHIGILGVEKKGEEWYQIILGGSEGEQASIGKILGPAVAKEKLASSVAAVVKVYLDNRESEKVSFLEFLSQSDLTEVKQAVYA